MSLQRGNTVRLTPLPLGSGLLIGPLKVRLPLLSRCWITGLVWALAWSVGSAWGAAPHADDTASPSTAPPVALNLALEHLRQELTPPERFQRLQAFYQQRGPRLIWHDEKGPTAAQRSLRRTLLQAAEQGLDPCEYNVALLHAHGAPGQALERAIVDVLLTDALLRYAEDVHFGRFKPAQVDPNWHIQRPPVTVAELAHEVLNAADLNAALAALPPPHAAYRNLQQALQRYRQLAAEGGWPDLKLRLPLRPGERSADVEQLAARLRITGELGATKRPEPNHYDNALTQAVKSFQSRHGLDADGVIGRTTLQALNVPVEQRLGQIRRSMERWRWLPREMGKRYVLVNMAAYRLDVIEHNSIALSLRTIIGKPYRSTPSFSDHIRYLELNPSWNIPPRIAREDLIPKQIRDPHFFARMNIRVLDSWGPQGRELDPASIDWSKLRGKTIPYRLRQDPGPGNSLGQIKFMFPNRFDVYVHDTPQRALFDRAVRTLSSGCVRVEHPLRLAQHVLPAEPRYAGNAIAELIRSRETRTLNLERPVPIYIVYLTVWADGDGRASFYPDIYGRDQWGKPDLERR